MSDINMQQIVDFVIAHDLQENIFEYLFVFKYGRHPNNTEKDEFTKIYNSETDADSYEYTDPSYSY